MDQKEQIYALLEAAHLADLRGAYAAADKLTDRAARTVKAYIGMNNFNLPLDTRMVPWRELDQEYKDIDKERQDFPRYQEPQYGDGLFTPQTDQLKRYEENKPQNVDDLGDLHHGDPTEDDVNQFSMHGTNSEGPALVIHDHTSPSQMGGDLKDREWKNHYKNNPSDRHKNLIPHI
jgi:hypothetical protein